MKVIALMPMKGHSERVPNKNMKDFNGMPLYHAVMHTLLDCPSIDEVVVNTDGPLLMSDLEANFPEVKVRNRDADLCGDMVSMNLIIQNDLDHTDGDIYIQTHSTNPILDSRTLESAIQFFIANKDKYDSVFSVTRWQTRLYWEDGKPLNHNPQELLRTQDLPKIYEENSCFFIFTKESFKAADQKRIGLNPYLYEINKLEATDIDEPEDFLIAELLHKSKNNKI